MINMQELWKCIHIDNSYKQEEIVFICGSGSNKDQFGRQSPICTQVLLVTQHTNDLSLTCRYDCDAVVGLVETYTIHYNVSCP